MQMASWIQTHTNMLTITKSPNHPSPGTHGPPWGPPRPTTLNGSFALASPSPIWFLSLCVSFLVSLPLQIPASLSICLRVFVTASFCPEVRSVERSQRQGPWLTCWLWVGPRLESAEATIQQIPWGTRICNALTSPGNKTRVSPLLGFSFFFIPTGTGVWQGEGWGPN